MQNNPNQDNQNFWNIIYSLLFVAISYELAKILISVNGGLPRHISFFDLSLITLATFRLTRLFVYDKITRFFRDKLLYSKGVERTTGPLLTAYELLSCPWCFSVWGATFVIFFYFLTPLAWLPILILAVSGIATLFQVTTNAIGWAAENGKIKASKG